MCRTYETCFQTTPFSYVFSVFISSHTQSQTANCRSKLKRLVSFALPRRQSLDYWLFFSIFTLSYFPLQSTPPPPAPYRSIFSVCSTESGSTTAHNLTLADKLGVELRAIECEIDIKVNSVECSLRGIHPLKVLLQILPRKIRGEGNHFFDTCIPLASSPQPSQQAA